MENLRTFLKDDSGQDLVEYVMLLALLVVAALTGVGAFGGSLGPIWEDLSTTVAGFATP
jgi:pilus assembly protein Flp/PilA